MIEDRPTEGGRDGRAPGERRRTDAGDTLVEILVALVFIGLTAVALLIAFSAAITSSADHRSLATNDTALRAIAESAFSQIQQQTNPIYTSCAQPSDYQGAFTFTAYTVHIDSITYWNSTNHDFESTCASGSIAPQLITVTVTAPNLSTETTSFVVDSRGKVAGGSTNVVVTSANPSSAGQGVSNQNVTVVGSGFAAGATCVFSGTGVTVNSTTFVNSFTLTVNVSVGASAPSGVRTITVLNTDGTTGTSAGIFTVTGQPSRFVLTPSTTTPTAGTPFTIALTVEDSNGALVSNFTGIYTVTWSGGVTSPGGNAPSYPTSTVSFFNGLSTTTLNATLFAAGSTTLTATEAAVVGSTTVTVGVSGSRFTVVPSTSTPIAGTAFTVTVTSGDAYGNVDTTYAGAQTLAWSGGVTSPGGNAPSYPANPVTFTSGVATGSVRLYAAGSNTLTVTQGVLSGSTTVTVGRASVNFLVVPSTSTPTAGVTFSVTVTAADTYGNIDTTYAGAKTLSWSGGVTSPGGNAPSYPANPITFTSGVVTGSVKLYAAGSNTLTVTQSALSGSTTVTVGRGASAFTVTPSTSTPNAGTQFSVTLTAGDAYGNVDSSYTGSKTVVWSGAGTVGTHVPNYPTGTVGFTSGVSTTTLNATLYRAGANSLTATAGSVAGTATITVTPLSTTQYLVTPSTYAPTVGVSFTVVLTAEDTYGNTDTSYAGSKAVVWSGAGSIGINYPSYPAASVSFTAGVSTGTLTVTIYRSGANNLTATSGTITGTAALGLFAGPDLFLVSPSTTTPTAGTSFTVTLTVQDAYGNPDTTFVGSKTISWSGASNSPGGNGPIYPTGTVNFTSGASTTTLTLTLKNAGSNTFTATNGGTTGSATVTVSPAAAARLVWAAGYSSTKCTPGGTLYALVYTSCGSPSNAVFTASISLADQYGNLVTNTSGSGLSVTVTSSGGGSFTGSSTVSIANNASTSGTGITFTTSGTGNWSNTITAAGTGYTSATASFTK